MDEWIYLSNEIGKYYLALFRKIKMTIKTDNVIHSRRNKYFE